MKHATWTFNRALAFVRDLNPKLIEKGFWIGLTGSVLVDGESKNDLDIIIYPMDSTRRSVDMELAIIHDALRSFGMRELYSKDFVTQMWRKAGSNDDKWVESWLLPETNHRVDVFLLR